MDAVLTLVGIAAAAGLSVWALVSRWPNHDPAAPRLRSRLHTRLDPGVFTGLALTLAVGAAVLGVAAAGLLLLMIRTETGVAHYDLSFARWGASHATSGSTTVLRRLSDLGGTLGVVSLSVIVGTIEYRRLANRAIPALLVLTVGGQFAVVNLVKVIVDRARPDLEQLTGFSSSSFPSGHAAAAAATFAALALLLGRRRSRRVRAVLAGLAVGVAVTVAGTRVLLGVHWLTDVLAGLAVGWAWFALWSIAFGGRLLHFGAPAEPAGPADDRAGPDAALSRSGR
ncbi:MAG TPA: phosphatase PAP2 family protein [Acidimicrobiia bacterium]|nr:phosphatase PAP2 family protein [Acidimicrobiia bacterium]